MGTLIETRTQYVKRLDSIKAMQKAQIDEKVEAYRKQLEAQVDNTEVNKLQEVIAALDKVISFESQGTSTDYVVREAAMNATPQHVEGRVGMAAILSPERR